MNHARFVAGTGTDVGKTIVSAMLALRLHANYFKPIQSGTPTDSDFMREVLGKGRVFEEAYRLKNPLSPNQAAAIECVDIDIARVTVLDKLSQGHLIVEGAGGLLTPINDTNSIVDMISHLELKTILVARSGLGTITHTMQSVDLLAARNIDLSCIILFGRPYPLNKHDIAFRSGVKTIEFHEIKNLKWEDL